MDTAGDLPLRDDELLSEQRVLGDQPDARSDEVRDQPAHEPNEVIHALVVSHSRVRMAFVARTGGH